MIIAIRIVLSLIALCIHYWFLPELCYYEWFPKVEDYWRLNCVASYIGYCVGIPLAIALVAGYLKKSKPVFWNVFVGALVIMPVVIYFVVWLQLS